MSTIILPHRWTAQPQYPVEIDWGHPAAQNAVIWTPWSPSILYGNRIVYGTEASIAGMSPTKAGVGRRWSRVGNAGVSFGVKQIITQNTGMTALVVAAPVNAAAMKCAFSQRIGSGAFTQTDVVFNASDDALTASAGAFTLLNYHNGNAVVRATGQTDGAIHSWVASNSTTAGYLYRDGVPQTLGTNSRSSTLVNTSQELRIGNLAADSSANYAHDDPLLLVVIWDRQLPQELARELSANPWQIFRPITKRIYVGVSSANTYTLTAAQGSFTETGSAATLAFNRALTAAKGTFTLTGRDATFPRSRVFTADKGTFNLTGNAVSFQYGSTYALTAEKGAFSLTGNTATFPRSRVFAADSGSIVLTGNAVNLNYSGAADYSLPCNTGSFALTGNAIAASKTVQEGKRLKFWTGIEWKA